MPKEVLVESRFDFRGGRNSTFSEDALQANELVESTNARLVTQYGAIARRTGSRRMHETAIGSGNAITGLFQWDQGSGTNQVVAICNGLLYHKTSDFGAFTELDPATDFSTSAAQYFGRMRAATSGAPLRLYIGDGVVVNRFTGSAVTKVDGTNSVPNADLLIPYHTRMFWRDADFVNHLFWSVVGDPENAEGSGVTAGGSGIIGTLASDDLTALTVVGSSLIIATGDGIVRFSGYSSDDIQIAQDTEGISSEVGVVGPLALARIENLAAFLSDRGPFILNESGVQPIGMKVEADFDGLDYGAQGANIAKAVVGYHRGRREVWFAVPGSGDSDLNKTVYVYSLRLQAWYGPFTYPFAITCFSRYEDSNGSEWLIAGCTDGFVRHMDTGVMDDVLFDASGGSAVTLTAELAPMFFDTGPGYVKSLRRIYVEADLPAGCATNIGVAFDNAAFADTEIVEAGTGTRPFRVDPPEDKQGKRLRVRITDANTTVIPIISGLSVEAFDTRRT